MLRLKPKEISIMRIPTFTATTAATLLVLSGMAFAQTQKAEEDHSAHHPAGNTPPAAAPASNPDAAPAPEAIDRQMKAMQDMHQKMQAAKTAAERAKLMDEHMKLMRSGMAMMGQMRGGAGQPPAANAGAMGNMMGMHMHMERRMALMEQMMQMMVDREAARTGP